MAGNVINSGLNLMNTAYNGAGGIVLSGDAVKGGYFVTDTIENIPSWANVLGTLCYCTGDLQFYQYNGTSWEPKQWVHLRADSGLLKQDESGALYVAPLTLDDIPEQEKDKKYVHFTPTEQTKLSSIEEGANNYSHPNYTEKSIKLYKIAVDNLGHVSEAQGVEKKDITDLGIPEQDTQYEVRDAKESGVEISLVTTGEKYIWNNHTHEYIPKSDKGTANGVAPLGSDSKIAATYLPTIPSIDGLATENYVDDALAQKTQVQIHTWGDDD